MKTRQVFEKIRDFIDREVMSLSQEEYLEVLEELASDIEMKIDTVKQELEGEG